MPTFVCELGQESRAAKGRVHVGSNDARVWLSHNRHVLALNAIGRYRAYVSLKSGQQGRGADLKLRTVPGGVLTPRASRQEGHEK